MDNNKIVSDSSHFIDFIKNKPISHIVAIIIGFTVFFYTTTIVSMLIIQIYIDNPQVNDAYQQLGAFGLSIYPYILPALIFKPIYDFLSSILNTASEVFKTLGIVAIEWIKKIK
jgi:hypothetical protein